MQREVSLHKILHGADVDEQGKLPILAAAGRRRNWQAAGPRVCKATLPQLPGVRKLHLDGVLCPGAATSEWEGEPCHGMCGPSAHTATAVL
jgi:hypothetical protein